MFHNLHHFPGSTGTASVGEAHRLALRITTDDDGTGGFAPQWLVERIRCINPTLLRGARTVLRARHTREDLATVIEAALAAQGEIAESFASTWRAAWTSQYVDQARAGGKLDGLEALTGEARKDVAEDRATLGEEEYAADTERLRTALCGNTSTRATAATSMG